MAASLSRSATWAAPTSSGTLPNALLKTTRSRSPPSETRTICRSVWFLKFNGAGGVKPARPPPGPPGPPRPGPGPNATGAQAEPSGAAAGGPAGAVVDVVDVVACGRTTTAVAQVPTQ